MKVKAPKLRFPEFSIDYSTKNISDIANRVINPVLVEDGVEYTEIGIRSHGRGIFHKKKTTSVDIGNKRVFWIEPNLFIVNIVFAWEQAIAVTSEKEVGKIASHRFPMFKASKEEVSTEYLHRFFLTKRGKHLLGLASPGGAGRNKTLGQKEFEKLKVKLPEVKEQNKVTSFLSTVDKKISLLKQKHEKLVLYKKGIMQQLYSQQLRFKDDEGQGFPDWHVKKLGKITSKTGKKNKDGTSYPVYSINNKEGFLPQSDQFEGMNSEERGFDISMYKIVEKNTFAYNPARINVGSIGFSGELENIIVSSLYVCFQTKSELSDRYLMAYLDTYDFNKSVLRNAEGGVRQYLFYENFCNIRIPLPGLDEQNKIADFLDSIDQKINLAKQQIAQTQAYKQGLLQQMFV